MTQVHNRAPEVSYAIVLCADCHEHQSNVSPSPLYSNNSSCESCHEAGVDCPHEGFADIDFSSRPCGICGTTLAGSRHHYQEYETPTR